jgi:release factor glutamine methyltransferase
VTGAARPTPTGSTRASALADLRRAFTEAGLDTPALDARLLVLAALGITPAELLLRPEASLTREETEALAAIAKRRLAREPVARILGEREFWGLPFALSPETLVPRPDTETLVETALRLVPDRTAALRILDLGTGSGCLLVALLHELRAATGIGADRALGALLTARANAWRNQVGARAAFVVSDWGSALAGRFDLIVSNPPYIPAAAIAGLDADVRDHDPRLALDGGPDGLDAYRTILHQARRLLGPGGLLVLEIGYDQAEALPRLARPLGLEILAVAPDLSGHPRCIALTFGQSDDETPRSRIAPEKGNDPAADGPEIA